MIAEAMKVMKAVPAAETQRLMVRKHETWSPGDAAHQGDLVLVCLRSLPAKRKSRKNRQVADGDTRGSRHVVAGGKVFDADAATLAEAVREVTKGRVVVDPRYIGPVFSGPCVLEHPQHQHQEFPSGTVTAVLYQRNLTAEEREVRARD